MTDEHLAREAARLLADEVLRAAFDEVRREALEALAACDADDRTAILRLQAKAAVIDEVRAGLGAAILRGAPQRDGRSSVV